jgi:Fe-S cluster assembly protein SufD
MQNITENIGTEQRMIDLFKDNFDLIRGNEPEAVTGLRHQAIEIIKTNGFPDITTENWRFTDLDPLLRSVYDFDFNNHSRPFDITQIFTCDVYDLDTFSVTLLNGWFVYQNSPLTTLKNGTIIGSLSKAMEVYPELVSRYLGKIAPMEQPGLTALNTALFQDGLFIYVPEDVKVDKPIQLINIINSEKPVMFQPRHLVIQETGSELTLVHCDHSLTHNISFTNSVSEAFLAKKRCAGFL